MNGFLRIAYLITAAMLLSTGVWCQDETSREASIEEVINDPPSTERDSTLVHNYNALAENYAGRDDSLSFAYIDAIDRLRARSQWDRADGLYYRALGKYHDRRGEYEAALESYTHSIDALESVGDRSEYIAYAYIRKAFVLSNNGLTDEGRELLEQVQPITEQLDNKDCLAFILDAYGDYSYYTFFNNRDLEKALGYYKQVEELLPQVTRPMIPADNAHCLAGCYLRLGQEELAFQYIDKALALGQEHGLAGVIFAVYGDLADFYEEQGDYDAAIPYRTLSLEYAQKEHWIEMESRGEKNLAFTYKAAGDYENALLHFERWQVIEDSLSRFGLQERFAELEARYELERKNLEIERLKAANLTLWRNVLVMLLLAGIVFMLYYRRVNRKLKGQNAELQTKNAEIQAALTEGRNLERQRMAIELHDNVNAKIAATKWMIESLEDHSKSEDERRLISSLVDQITEIYEDVRFISHNLVPKEIEDKSLAELLNVLVFNLNQNQRIRFTLNVDESIPALSNSHKLQTYSMIMELVNNVLKHSESTAAVIDVELAEGALHFRVRDDGVGFDPGQESAGTGLGNVRARLASLNGSMHVSQSTTGGTDIEISVPLPS